MMNSKNSKADSFTLNLLDRIGQRQCRENEITTDFFKTRLEDYYLLKSIIVAEVVFVKDVSENYWLLKGEVLCSLKYLGCNYNILMEENGYIQKKYIVENQIIDYSHPLFLFKTSL